MARPGKLLVEYWPKNKPAYPEKLRLRVWRGKRRSEVGPERKSTDGLLGLF